MPYKNSCFHLFFICASLAFLITRAFANPLDKIIFQHIPKSGGVTVSSLLMNEYHQDQIINSQMQKIDLYSYGFHLSLFEIDKILNTSDYKLITFIRNPIDRVLSEHRYCIGKHKADPHILAAHRLPPYGDPIETASNIVCKMLSGLDDQDNSIPISMHLDNAKRMLNEKFFFVGITEKMEDSIRLLYNRLGWNMPEEIPHFNATTDQDNFSDEVLQAIAQRNWADIELYEHALKIYDLQKSQADYSLDEDFDSNNKFNDHFFYTFDQKLTGFGWGLREIDPMAGKVYRWATEKNEAGIDFCLQSDFDYTFECTILIQPILYPQLTVLVNNVPIPLQAKISENVDMTEYKWICYQGTIMQSLLKKGQKTRVTFRMIAPNDLTIRQFYEKNSKIQTLSINYTRGKFACGEVIFKKER
jgi:hypothetical protein